MRFEDERYVRLYVRDTTTWLMLKWEGQSVFALLLRKVDRSGIFDLGGSDPYEAVAAVLQMPDDIVRVGLNRLLSRGVIERAADCLVFPRFIEAQEATMSPTTRQKESRLRRRDQVRSGIDPSARKAVIYFIQSENGGPIKIGYADDLAKRLVSLQTSRPDKLVVVASFVGTIAHEKELHARFSHVREMGEWFTPVPELMDLIRDIGASGAYVTKRDLSRNVTCHEMQPVTTSHETNAVTLNRTVLNRAVPYSEDPTPKPPSVEPPTSARPGVASVGGFGFENRRPEADERVANADSSPATGPQSSLRVANVGRPTTGDETQSWGDSGRTDGSVSATASREGPESPRSGRIFEEGTAGMTELCAVYVQAVATATKQPFAMPPDRSSRQALATAVNTHLRGDGTARGALAQLAPAVTQWVGQYRDRSAFTAGWAPRKFLDWLNAGRADPKASVTAPEQPKRKIHYLTGDEP